MRPHFLMKGDLSVGNDSVSGAGGGMGSQTNASAVAQTANIGRSTSVTSGAAKVFREFKWGLLTLFLLMVVVIALVYDGGKKRKSSAELDGAKRDDAGLVAALDGAESGAPPVPVNPNPPANGVTPPPTNVDSPAPVPQPQPITNPDPQPRVTLPTPPVAPLPPAPVAGHEYTVKGGDTLTSIANTMLPGKG